MKGPLVTRIQTREQSWWALFWCYGYLKRCHCLPFIYAIHFLFSLSPQGINPVSQICSDPEFIFRFPDLETSPAGVKGHSACRDKHDSVLVLEKENYRKESQPFLSPLQAVGLRLCPGRKKGPGKLPCGPCHLSYLQLWSENWHDQGKIRLTWSQIVLPPSPLNNI